ncbi:hypothetical protein ACSBR1_038951 [Camellia fascicularis]
MAAQMSKKRKFVADGVFFAELNDVLTRELAEDRYSGVTPMRTEIIIRATRTKEGKEDQRADIGCTETLLVSGRQWSCTPRKSITGTLCYCSGRVSPIQAPPRPRCSESYAPCFSNPLMLYSCGINAPGLMSLTMLFYLRACYGVLRFIMESGAKGCEVIVSGKLRAQHAKSMRFKDGYMISSGQPVNEYIDSAVRHVLLRQGVLGIKVKIMLDWDPKGKQGLETPLPDLVTIHTPKEEEEHIRPAIMPTEIESPMA